MLRGDDAPAAVNELPEAQKLLVTLRYYERLTLKKAAGALGVEPAEAEGLQEQAIVSLSRQLGPVWPRRVSDWDWPSAQMECGIEYSRYARALERHYEEYFAARPEEGGRSHPRLANDAALALPPDWGELAGEIRSPHRWHLSGRSSQTLALGMLGPLRQRDPSLSWLFEPQGPMPALGEPVESAFEHELERDLLDERGRSPTTIDFFASGNDAVLCVEVKLGEDGIGRCSCDDYGGDPKEGVCADTVVRRTTYWDTADEAFGLPPEPQPGGPCRLSFAYQAVRNAAAALALAGEKRRAIFGLIYDARNPYFAGCGNWPGWPRVLDETLADHPRLEFRAVSWQDFLAAVPLPPEVRDWAREKHRLLDT